MKFYRLIFFSFFRPKPNFSFHEQFLMARTVSFSFLGSGCTCSHSLVLSLPYKLFTYTFQQNYFSPEEGSSMLRHGFELYHITMPTVVTWDPSNFMKRFIPMGIQRG
jgi:hypothetical protein